MRLQRAPGRQVGLAAGSSASTSTAARCAPPDPVGQHDDRDRALLAERVDGQRWYRRRGYWRPGSVDPDAGGGTGIDALVPPRAGGGSTRSTSRGSRRLGLVAPSQCRAPSPRSAAAPRGTPNRWSRAAWERYPHVAVRKRAHGGEHMARLAGVGDAGAAGRDRESGPVQFGDQGLAVDVQAGEGDDVRQPGIRVAMHDGNLAQSRDIRLRIRLISARSAASAGRSGVIAVSAAAAASTAGTFGKPGTRRPSRSSAGSRLRHRTPLRTASTPTPAGPPHLRALAASSDQPSRQRQPTSRRSDVHRKRNARLVADARPPRPLAAACQPHDSRSAGRPAGSAPGCRRRRTRPRQPGRGGRRP